jgi:hypothetical protein
MVCSGASQHAYQSHLIEWQDNQRKWQQVVVQAAQDNFEVVLEI